MANLTVQTISKESVQEAFATHIDSVELHNSDMDFVPPFDTAIQGIFFFSCQDRAHEGGKRLDAARIRSHIVSIGDAYLLENIEYQFRVGRRQWQSFH